MFGSRIPRRLWVFLGGIGFSLAIVGIIVLSAELQFSLIRSGHGSLRSINLVCRLLGWVFLIANPIFTLVGWASLAVPAHLTSTRLGQIVIGCVYAVAFLGGWWLVATVVDQVTSRKPRSAG